MIGTLTSALDRIGVEYRTSGDRAVDLELPGSKKLSTPCSLIVEDHALRVEAFVSRRPEENREAVWAELLRRNGRLYAVGFALDETGDIHLVGRLPLDSVNPLELDRVLGSALEAADDTFNVILEIGFASSIREEWRWRLSRGESTRNLAAFEHLRPGD
ncbi:type III secretion system chaperone family protein [Glycomyces xiaoerkulensis]|uniref:YbjN domain-containing protein n=1 Tax=Glycomyces xiaoerkulensis TaxID=2038139 RepID=UPI000C25A5CD|nr:YbjN domain-containing protein [Glycomyces xiaoerkulensis]